jgi:LysM repeat protein
LYERSRSDGPLVFTLCQSRNRYRPFLSWEVVIHGVVLLAAIALAVTLALGTSPTPVPSATFASHLPSTQPGLSPNEGVFLSTAADNGSQVTYFVAQNVRHSILLADVQMEEQINPLWPWRTASRDEVMAYAEAAPIGGALVGLLPAAPRPDASAEANEPDPVASAPTVAEPAAPRAEAPTVVEPAAPTAAAPIVAQVAAPEAVESQPSVYVLQPGDNLIRISARYGTTVQAILDNNGLTNANRILIGQTLTIPRAADVPAVAEANPVAEARDDAVADTPDTTADGTYTVQRGDSAILIARRMGISEQALLEANGIRNANLVMIGQTLTIPANG